MFWVTQPGGGAGVWATALDPSDTTEIIVPARTARFLVISCSRSRRVSWLVFRGKYAEHKALAQDNAHDGAMTVWLRIISISDAWLHFVSSAYAPFQSAGGGLSM